MVYWPLIAADPSANHRRFHQFPVIRADAVPMLSLVLLSHMYGAISNAISTRSGLSPSLPRTVWSISASVRQSSKPKTRPIDEIRARQWANSNTGFLCAVVSSVGRQNRNFASRIGPA
jgi:hypothetical protein